MNKIQARKGMKTKINIILLILTLGLGSCMKEDMWIGESSRGESGTLEVLLNNRAQAYRPTATRADNQATDNGSKTGVFDAAELDVQRYQFELRNAQNTLLHSGSVNSLKGNNGRLQISPLQAGSYTAMAQNYDGSNVSVSKRPWFRAQNEVTILPGKATAVELNCKLQQIEVIVQLSESFKQVFKDDYSITIDNGAQAAQTYDKNNIGQKYYYQVPQQKTGINVNVKATTRSTDSREETVIVRTYNVTKPADAEGNSYLSPGDAFVVNLTEDGSHLSYIDFGISVDFSFAEQTELVRIPTDRILVYEETGGTTEPDPEDPPTPSQGISFKGLPASYTNPSQNGTPVSVDISAPSGIKNLFVSIQSDNTSFAETIAQLGLAGEFDIANPGALESVLTHSLESGEGIGLIKPEENIAGKTSYRFDVSSFMALLPLYGAGRHTFHIEVVDNAGNRQGGDLVINITQ